ncbi:MAG: endonuclease/exonuclease/phosphatase family protein [Halobacteriovoraceae bacterium]|nr:endonuclease/exonuclease/phosphatase family protein [Halobacteriovoraceae bacterium]
MKNSKISIKKHIISFFIFLLFGLANAEQGFSNANILKVATYNIGMLDFLTVTVPYIKEREESLQEEMAWYLTTNDIDVLALQEVWTKNSQENLQNIPGYILLLAPDKMFAPLGHKTGLAFLVKETIIHENKDFEFKFIDFQTREGLICLAGSLCERGILQISFKKNGILFSIFNTHLTPLISSIDKRKNQMNEIAQMMNEPATNEDVIILAGDLNLSLEVGELREGDDGTLESWLQNGKLYDDFFAKGDSCFDAYFTAFNKPSYFTQDRDNNLTAQASSAMIKEPNQRLDHIFYCLADNNDTDNPFSEIETKAIFTDATIFLEDGNTVHLSDHFGVETTFKFK